MQQQKKHDIRFYYIVCLLVLCPSRRSVQVLNYRMRRLNKTINKDADQVWGISKTRDQNYRSNARPRLTLADLLTEVVILQLRRGSEQ